MVQITLGDVNDNGPFFNPAIPSGSVLEMVQSGSTVMDLRPFTQDPDTQANNGVGFIYQIVPGDHTNFFNILQSGEVVTKVPIDREQHSDFQVPVVVFDQGSPAFSSSLTFSVVIDDINDTPPRPRNMLVQVGLNNNTYPVSSIADVRPLDGDLLGDHTCEIIQSSSNDFEIAPNGCLLRIKNRPSQNAVPEMRVKGSDGQNFPDPEYSVTLNFVNIDKNMKDNTVVLKIQQQTPDSFLEQHYSELATAVEGLFSNGESVLVYNIHADGPNILVFMVVKKSDGSYIMSYILNQQITSNKASIESSVGVVFLDIGYSVCKLNTCGTGECVNMITVGTQTEIADSSLLVISSPDIKMKYFCKCPVDFTGANCSVPVEPCGSANCQHGGTCITGQNNAKICVCSSGWTGAFCETDINECDDNICANGRCEDTEGSFICHCPEGFSGKVCDVGFDSCSSGPCQNGGTCRNLPQGYRCECPFAHWGQDCERVSVGFQQGSYMEFSPVGDTGNDIDVTFSTLKQNALLLYNPSSTTNDFIALEIIEGRIRFSFNLGDPQSTRITVPRKVADGKWYNIKVHRNRKVGGLHMYSVLTVNLFNHNILFHSLSWIELNDQLG